VKKYIINSFRNKKVLLIGDTMLDVYIYGDIIGEALDAPVPEVEERKISVSPGGNGLIANNILELGGKLTFISIVGDDADAKFYDEFAHKNLKKIFLVDKTRRSTVKRRWYAGGKKLLQVNKVDNHYLIPSLEKKLLSYIKQEVKKADVIVVMDPQHGMMTRRVIIEIIKIAKKHKKPFYVDAQISHRPSNHHLYKWADTMFLNQNEAKVVYSRFDIKKLQDSLRAIQKKLRLNNVIVKLGARGSAVLWAGQFIRTSPYKVKTVDVCGAGDAFLAAFSLGDRNKPEESLEIANKWAALSTTIHGTIPPKRKML